VLKLSWLISSFGLKFRAASNAAFNDTYGSHQLLDSLQEKLFLKTPGICRIHCSPMKYIEQLEKSGPKSSRR
jgi:hypothetical protein